MVTVKSVRGVQVGDVERHFFPRKNSTVFVALIVDQMYPFSSDMSWQSLDELFQIFSSNPISHNLVCQVL